MVNPFMIVVLFVLVVGIWIFVTIVKGVLSLADRAEASVLGPRRRSGAVQIGPPPRPGLAMNMTGVPINGRPARVCPYELCKAPNDATAHFCRRCGRELAPPDQLRTRRAGVRA